jgi:tRNA pseudouridine55 synthase
MPSKVTGAILVDKPAGISSHDVVARVRQIANQSRCGHTGTLDPFATGLLVLCLGRATRLARFLSGSPKDYLATIRFGFATTTYDRTGTPVGERTDRCPDREALEDALVRSRGRQEQRPPPFSAKRVNGKRAYKLARAGIPVEPAAVQVEIQDIRLLELAPPLATIHVRVTSGTYVRSLAHDLGARLSAGAHLQELRRTGVGSFRVEESATLDDLARSAAEGKLGDRVVSPAGILRDLPSLGLEGDAALRFVHGRDVPLGGLDSGNAASFIRILGAGEELLGVAERRTGAEVLRPVIVWESAREEKAQGS